MTLSVSEGISGYPLVPTVDHTFAFDEVVDLTASLITKVDLSYEQNQAGNTAIYVFGASVLFVFMVLAAHYDSWSQPLFLSIFSTWPICPQ
jgi:hypothetical protein